MNENEITAVDNSDEPITAEWFNAVSPPGIYLINGLVVLSSETVFPGCKTRGDFRDLCRLLGVPME